MDRHSENAVRVAAGCRNKTLEAWLCCLDRVREVLQGHRSKRRMLSCRTTNVRFEK